MGSWPNPPRKFKSRVTGTLPGDGFVIEKVAYESRPGDWVPGHLYRPANPTGSMPGILIAHAHHWGKNHGELQDMGMTWARAGCLVLVIDQVGYGERRAHPFHAAEDYAGKFRVGRQDYYHRYDSGIQLHLAAESLMGWMAWDLMRGVDLLLARDGIDSQRIIILGAVAGGGDPCGITAALDKRIAAAVPFNFGGPQPETTYPLPNDAERSFNYLMGSYWESTRGLRRTAADGFFHWMITASLAPRRLIHAHEFSWDGERDPVWKRYQKVYGEFYAAADNLAVAHGKGLLRGNSSEASHCGQIGRFHRRMIHPAFERWFGIEVREGDEYRARRSNRELICLPEGARRDLKPATFTELVSAVGEERVAAMRAKLAPLTPADRRRRLREQWEKLLGEITPSTPPKIESSVRQASGVSGIDVLRVILETEPGVALPLLLLRPEGKKSSGPTVVAIAQSGKAGFLHHRSSDLAALVNAGAVVCLPDLRGTGEIKAGTARGRTSGDTNRSVNMLLHNQTVLGQRLRDLNAILAYLRGLRPRADIMLWGDSFATTNPPDTNFQVPRGVGARPQQAEPLGGLLALLGALFNDDVRRVYVHRGLSSFRSALRSPHVYLPHDVVVPGVLSAGDLADLAAALAPRPLRLDAMVDGLNRSLNASPIREEFQPAVESYQRAGAAERFMASGRSSLAQWLLGK